MLHMIWRTLRWSFSPKSDGANLVYSPSGSQSLGAMSQWAPSAGRGVAGSWASRSEQGGVHKSVQCSRSEGQLYPARGTSPRVGVGWSWSTGLGVRCCGFEITPWDYRYVTAALSTSVLLFVRDGQDASWSPLSSSPLTGGSCLGWG